MLSNDSDTHILHKLGVFDNQNPIKIDNDIRGNVDGDDDQAELLIKTEKISIKNEFNDELLSPYYTLHCITFYSIIFTFSLCYGFFLFNSAHIENDKIYFSKLILISFGMPVGFFISGYLYLQFNVLTSSILSTFIAYLIVFISLVWGFEFLYGLCFFAIGVVAGIFERNIYLFVNEYCSRKWKFNLSISLIVLLFGLLNVSLMISPQIVDNTSIQIRNVRSVTVLNDSVIHPTKPASAIGISELQDTKTAENAEKRKLAEMKVQEKLIDCEYINGSSLNSCNKSDEDVQSTLSSSTETKTTLITTTTSTTIPTTVAKTTEQIIPIIKNRSRNRVINNVDENEEVQSTTAKYVKEEDLSDFVINKKLKYLMVFGLILHCFIAIGGSSSFFSSLSEIYNPNLHDNFTDIHTTLSMKVTSCIVWILLEIVGFSCIPIIPLIIQQKFPEGLLLLNHQFSIIPIILASVIIIRFLIVLISKKCLPGTIVLTFYGFVVISYCILLFYTKFIHSYIISTIMMLLTVLLSSDIYISLRDTTKGSPLFVSGRLLYSSSFGRILSPFIVSKIMNNALIEKTNYFGQIEILLVLLLIFIIILYRLMMITIRRLYSMELANELKNDENSEKATERKIQKNNRKKKNYTALNTDDGENDDFDVIDFCSDSDDALLV